MKEVARKVLVITALLGVLTFLIPSHSTALAPITVGEESELDLYGWLRNNAGMFLEDSQPFAQSGSRLATVRTWVRGYTELRISRSLRFGGTIQFAYEPEYPIEDHAGGSFETPVDPESLPDGKEYSEYKNVNDVIREAYIAWKPIRGTNIKIGRQIAIWGEALTTRVGDVIQPEDQRFTLAFANLEDTRIPQWMIRTIHDLGSISSTFEWIVSANFVEDKYRVNRLANFISLGQPGQRFSLNPETRFRPPFSVNNPFLHIPSADPSVVIPHPFSRDWIFLPDVPGTGYVPTALPLVTQEFPEVGDLRGGFRTSTTLGGYTFGVSYFHTQNYDPVIERGALTGITVPGIEPPIEFRQYTLVHPNIDIIGAYLNKDLASIPGVVRAEMIYVPNKPFQTFDPNDFDTMVERDYVKYMVAYDLTGYLFFSWHKTAPFDITLEHVGEWVPDNEDLQYISYSTDLKGFNPSFNMRIVTNWRYNQISTEIIASYIPWGSSGLLMPIVKYVPPVLNNQLSFELRYINVFGELGEGLGILHTKDMLVLTSQLNW